MNDFEKIEHLLLSKRFEELSPTEVREVNDYFENATDYNDMRDTLMQVKSTLAADKLLIKPNVELKEKLLQQFDKTYANQASNVAGKSRPFYKNVGFQWAAAASVVIIISVSIFGYLNNMGGQKSDEMAINYETKKNAPSSINEESTVPSGENTSSTGSADLSATEGKEKILVINPENTNALRSEDESEKIGLYGNFYNTETEVNEGTNNLNAPLTNSMSSQSLLLGSANDNSTLGGVNTNVSKEESKDDADFHLNDRILTNAYKEDDMNKGVDMNYEKNTNTTIPVEDQTLKKTSNTTLLQVKRTNGKDYWANKKNRNKAKSDNDNKGFIGVNNGTVLAEKDSLLAKTDTVNVDSNKKLLENNNSIQMEDNKKDD